MNGKEFLGRGLKFPLQVDPRTGKFTMSSQEEDIREATGIILNTVVNVSCARNLALISFSIPLRQLLIP